jgi:hypothetical protein
MKQRWFEILKPTESFPEEYEYIQLVVKSGIHFAKVIHFLRFRFHLFFLNVKKFCSKNFPTS